jgi:hypothetical protein
MGRVHRAEIRAGLTGPGEQVRPPVRLDEWTVRLPGMHRAGLQVVDVVERSVA